MAVMYLSLLARMPDGAVSCVYSLMKLDGHIDAASPTPTPPNLYHATVYHGALAWTRRLINGC